MFKKYWFVTYIESDTLMIKESVMRFHPFYLKNVTIIFYSRISKEEYELFECVSDREQKSQKRLKPKPPKGRLMKEGEVPKKSCIIQ